MINKLLLLGVAYFAYTTYQKRKLAAPTPAPALTPMVEETSPEQASSPAVLTVDDALKTQSNEGWHFGQNKETYWTGPSDGDEDFVGMGGRC